VLATLAGHTGLVSCLALAADPADTGSDLVASGGADSRVLVWRVGPAGAGALLATLAVHSGPITALALLPAAGGLTVASTATDSTICTSTVALEAPVEGSVVEGAEWRQELGGGLALALHLISLPGQAPLLVVARDTCRLLLLQVMEVLDGAEHQVLELLLLQGGRQLGVLEGHEDWVTCLAAREEVAAPAILPRL
jgi:WD40 repeat protein